MEIKCDECKFEKVTGKCFHKYLIFGTIKENGKKRKVWLDPHYNQELNKGGKCLLFKRKSIFSFLRKEE